jgi:phosphate/sulfate permease
MATTVFAASIEVRNDYARAGIEVPKRLADNLTVIENELKEKLSFDDLPRDKNTRWEVRQAIASIGRELKKAAADEKLPEELRNELGEKRKQAFLPAVEYVPLWVVIGTALALGIGTTIGYKRIVKTVAEKIGKQHLTYAQGAAAETIAASTILISAVTGLPVSTTHVLNSGVAGTMVANRSGIQGKTVTKILLAWVFTLPSCIFLAGGLYWLGRTLVS